MAPSKAAKSKPRSSKNNKKTNRQLSRLYTGIPVASRKNRSDPKPLPTSMSQAIRVMFQIVYMGNTVTSGFDTVLILPPNAGEIGTIQALFDPTASESSRKPSRTKEIAVTRNNLFQAAAVRLFGQPLTATDTVATYLSANTEYALQSCTLYGPLSQQRETIRMRADFSSDTPGVAMFDTGDRLKRAVLHATASRLHWYGGNTSTETVARLTLDIPLGATGSANDPLLNASMGIFEAVVQIRRSFQASSTATSSSDAVLNKLTGVKFY